MSYISNLPDDIAIIIYKKVYKECMQELGFYFLRKINKYNDEIWNGKKSSWNIEEYDNEDLYEYHNYPDTKKVVYEIYWNWTIYEEIFIMNKPICMVLDESEKRWGDLYNVCDKLIRKSRDTHNTIIKNLTYDANTKTIELHTGEDYDIY